jgi:hypothetical protein
MDDLTIVPEKGIIRKLKSIWELICAAVGNISLSILLPLWGGMFSTRFKAFESTTILFYMIIILLGVVLLVWILGMHFTGSKDVKGIKKFLWAVVIVLFVMELGFSVLKVSNVAFQIPRWF